VNTDFIVNTLKWNFRSSRHPELLEILRRADLVTADGMPVVWSSRMLGPAIPERVTGADLVPRLAQESAARGKSIYFLGGNPGSAEKASDILKELHPGLKIAGWSSPFVHTEGPGLVNAGKEDQELVDRINASRPDILLIAFGNPKQEIWFNLNRHRLQVPVSIGVGGTFEFIIGSIRRAPTWMGNYGLEWLFRFTQDPQRLWKRYLMDFGKFGLLVWPSILIHQYLKRKAAATHAGHTGAFSSQDGDTRDIPTITLPGIVDSGAIPGIADLIPDKPETDLVINAGNVSFIDSAGLACLADIFLRWKDHGRQAILEGVPAVIRRQVRYSRLSDLLTSGTTKPGFQIELRVTGHKSLIVISGGLMHPPASHEIFSLVPRMKEPSCIIDLSGCRMADTSGIIFLLLIRAAVIESGKTCSISGMGGDVKQMMKMTKVLDLFST
jgi:N-acetylglucosaminyldiphosphoundecaprenol N-acetyl-beta-D-mannosaminyltransferase